MNCQEFRSTILAQDDPSFEHAFSPAHLEGQAEHTRTCLDCVRWLEERMDVEDLERGVTSAIPIPGEAATAIETEAKARLDKVNAHLRRTVTEVHKMMIWHQYAAAALQGILARGFIPRVGGEMISDRKMSCLELANMACEYADAMMEQIRQRKLM